MSEGDVGMPPSSLPGEGATDTPEGDVGGEGLPLTEAHSCRALQEQRSKDSPEVNLASIRALANPPQPGNQQDSCLGFVSSV